MKKFIQISLVLLLVFVLFQAVSGGSMISNGTAASGAANNSSSALNATDDAQVTMECLAPVKGVICVRPKVGWNS